MAGLSSLAPQSKAKEIIDLAAIEGHDADIPTNIGVIRAPEQAGFEKEISLSAASSTKEGYRSKDVDLEKNKVFSQSSRSEGEEVGEGGEKEEEGGNGDEEAGFSTEPDDPNVVWWDGPNDPENPMNWPKGKKWGTIAVVSGITFLAPLASSLFAPGVPQVMKEFHSNSTLLAGFVVSVYVLGFAFGPLAIAPMSEMWGRNVMYQSCMLLFTIATVACALSTSLDMLIVFRFLAGTFGSAPLTLGGGTIADLVPLAQRGTAMTIWVMGPTIGPVVGPIAGGFLSEAAGWRWDFWVLAIIGGVGTALSLIMQETYAPTILSRKTARLRRESGNQNLRSKLGSGLPPKDLFLYSIVRPTKMLFLSPIVFSLSLHIAVVYAYIYLFFTTFTRVFEVKYGFSQGIVGLTFLGIGIGTQFGQFINTYFGNRVVRKHLARGTFKPEVRLYLMIPGAIFIPISLFWYGWSAEAKTHWVVPIIGTGFIGAGLLMTLMPASTYLIDVFTIHAASAMAASTVLRSVFAAVLPLAGQSMYDKLGLGWGNSLMAFIALALVPIPFAFVRYGEWIRTRFDVKL